MLNIVNKIFLYCYGVAAVLSLLIYASPFPLVFFVGMAHLVIYVLMYMSTPPDRLY